MGWLAQGPGEAGLHIAGLASAGLVIARDNGTGYYDRFRGSVSCSRSRICASAWWGSAAACWAKGRPKYLNSPDTPLFKKGQTLFALDHAREAIARTKTVIVVEGYFDAIALHQAGLTHTVATLGYRLDA